MHVLYVLYADTTNLDWKEAAIRCSEVAVHSSPSAATPWEYLWLMRVYLEVPHQILLLTSPLEPAPRKRPPEPARRKRPEVPAPSECTPEITRRRSQLTQARLPRHVAVRAYEASDWSTILRRRLGGSNRLGR